MVSEGLLFTSGIYHTRVEYLFISDHALIIIQLEMAPVYRSYPFKLNPLWVLEADYTDLVYNVWKDPKYNSEAGYQRRLQNKRIQVPGN